MTTSRPSSGKHLQRALARVELQKSLRADPRPWIEKNLWIRTKDERVIPFVLNWSQNDHFAHHTRRDIILKPRQLGFTTLISALFFADCLLRPNVTSVLVAHDIDSSEKIFRIVRLFWQRLPASEKALVGAPQYNRKGELFWPRIGSTYYVGTAGSSRFGHGLTISNLHCSEVSRWTHPEESMTGLLEAVPAGGRLVLESTANGIGNYFHDLWTEAKGGSGFSPHFYVWWEDPSYRIAGEPFADLTDEELKLKRAWRLDDDQIRWRRAAQQRLRTRFKEQYPEDDVSCFLASSRGVFDAEVLQRVAAEIAAAPAAESMSSLPAPKGEPVAVAPARLLVWRRPERDREYVIGADVGEGLAGGDASCAIVLDRRSGDQVAELHGRVAPDRFGHLLDVLGRWYNRAMLAVERNNHGHSTLNTLRNMCRYPRLYYHVRYDARAGSQTVLGWPTDQATKPILVDDLAGAIAEGAVGIRSADVVDECMTFVTTDSGSQEAQTGKFDDRVMAAGIAWQVRKRPVARGSTQRPAGW